MLIVMVMASCSSEKSISTNIHKDGLLSLFSEFTIVTLPIEVDSLSLPFFIKEIQKRKRIDKYWVDKIGIKSSSKITQGQNRYAYYKYGQLKITNDVILILYLVELNPEIPFDAYVYKIEGAIYDGNSLLDETELAVFRQEMGQEYYRYFRIDRDKSIVMKTKERKEIGESGEFNESITIDNMKLSEKGFIAIPSGYFGLTMPVISE